MSDSTRERFQTLARVLLRCWIFGFLLLFIWVGAFVSGAVHTVHGNLIGLSSRELDLIHYCGIGLLKICVLLFFFIPWLSILLVLRKSRR